MSLPLRERGLKHKHLAIEADFWSSLPLRERGLKHDCPWCDEFDSVVAPLAGAWIETCY